VEKITVRPTGKAQIEQLDDELNYVTYAQEFTVVSLAYVEESFENGDFFFKRATDGTYSVCVLEDEDPDALFIAKSIIRDCGFEIVARY